MTGPSEKDLADIESEDPGTGIYTPEQIEGLRRMNEKVDPAYARQRSARRGGTAGGIQPRGGAEAAISRVQGAFGTSGVSDKALTTLEGSFGTTNKKGEVMGVKGGGAEMGSSGDEPVSSPSMRAVGLGDISAPSAYYGKHKDTPGYQQGVMLLRTAGRCNHPRCQMIRAKGMEMIGAKERYQIGGQYWESKQSPIPSIASEKPYYPIVGGKEDRKNKQTYTELSPADPKHPEWLKAQAEAKGGTSMFDPSDLLEHHHKDEDSDFERYPLPF